MRALSFSPDGRRLVSGSDDTTLLVWDLTGVEHTDASIRPNYSAEHDLETLWKQLGDIDAVRSGRSLWRLTMVGRPAVSMLEKHLHPVEGASSKTLHRLIADLDSDNFKARQRAREALLKLGECCEFTLRRALVTSPSPEARRTLQQILASLDKEILPSDTLRNLRALEVLERIGSTSASRLLERLASGSTEARLSQEAQRALLRLKQSQERLKTRSGPAIEFKSWTSLKSSS